MLKRRSSILSRRKRSSLTPIARACSHCVSVAYQMRFFGDAPYSPNMRKQNGERLIVVIEKRGLLNNANNNDQEDGSQKSQPDSKEFRSDGVEWSAGVLPLTSELPSSAYEERGS